MTLSITLGLVIVLIAGSLGGLVILRKRGIPAFNLAGIGASNGRKTPSIPWSRNKKLQPAFDNAGTQSLQAGAFAANGSAWSPLNNNVQTLAGAAAFAAIPGLQLHNSQPLNQGYTPSALRPITTSLPAEYPHSRPLNTIQTSDMRPLSMDSLVVSEAFNQPADSNNVHPTSAERTSGTFSGAVTQLANPSTEPLLAAPRKMPVPSASPLSPQTPPAVPSVATPASTPKEVQSNTDVILETIMRQAQMGLYVLPDKQTLNRGDSNH